MWKQTDPPTAAATGRYRPFSGYTVFSMEKKVIHHMESSQVKKKIIIHSECIIDFRGRLSLSTMMYIMPIQTRPILHLLHNPGQNGEPQTSRSYLFNIFFPVVWSSKLQNQIFIVFR